MPPLLPLPVAPASAKIRRSSSNVSFGVGAFGVYRFGSVCGCGACSGTVSSCMICFSIKRSCRLRLFLLRVVEPSSRFSESDECLLPFLSSSRSARERLLFERLLVSPMLVLSLHLSSSMSAKGAGTLACSD